MRKIISLFFIVGLIFSNGTLGLIDNGDGTYDVGFSSDTPIGGFQFTVDGELSSASGGLSADAGFMISTGSGMVLGFSLSGATIDQAEGLLVQLGGSGITVLSGIVMSDASGAQLDFSFDSEWGSDSDSDCTDDPNGELGSFGVTCEQALGFFGCASSPWGDLVELCPLSCDTCPDDEGDGEVTDGCDLPLNNLYILADGSVLYNTDTPIGGFQFTVDGATPSDASGGASGDAGFLMSAGGGMVLGFSLTGATFDGCGTMTVVVLDGEPSGLSGIVVSDASGGELSFSYYGDTSDVPGCTDMSACNYDEDATEDDGSCEYAEENFDCDGNCTAEVDCAGECGGDAEDLGCGCGNAAPTIACEDTDGDGLGNPGTETEVCGEGRGANGSLGLTDNGDGTYDVTYTTDTAIGGFQFNVDGTLSGGSGGDAEGAGFMISAGGQTILGFSLMGSTFGPGSGTMIVLSGSDITTIEAIIISDAVGGQLDLTFGSDEEEATLVADCSDEHPDCASNEVDCAGECDGGAVVDCVGECGGSAVIDDCGVCGGDAFLGTDPLTGEDCSEFACYMSQIEGVNSVSECNDYASDNGLDFYGPYCDGNGHCVETGCYCNDTECDWQSTGTGPVDCAGQCGGDTTVDCAGQCGGDAILDECGVCDGSGIADGACDCQGNVDLGCGCGEECSSTVDISIDLHSGANLISFYGLPEDPSVANMMSSLGDIATGVIGEGVAATPNPVLGWVGSLTAISPTSGYWVKTNDDATLTVLDATPTDPDINYSLHVGANLISFPVEGSVSIASGIPDDVEASFTGVIGEGVAATPNPVLGWVGSLTSWQGGKGYWVKSDADLDFSFDLSTLGGMSRSSEALKRAPEGLDYAQSTQQAFYFVENIEIEDYSISHGDWVLVYNGNVLVGARQWNGAYTDIPAMGYDGTIETAGYCVEGDKLRVKVVTASGDEYQVGGSLPVWSSNELYTLGSLEAVEVPEKVLISSVYPNPFNPTTSIQFSVPSEGLVDMYIYSIDGREISHLVHDNFARGYHEVTWNASNVSSGLYLLTLKYGDHMETQKLMLMK